MDQLQPGRYTNTTYHNTCVRGVVDSVVPAAMRLFEPYKPGGARVSSDDAIARELTYPFSHHLII